MDYYFFCLISTIQFVQAETQKHGTEELKSFKQIRVSSYLNYVYIFFGFSILLASSRVFTFTCMECIALKSEMVLNQQWHWLPYLLKKKS